MSKSYGDYQDEAQQQRTLESMVRLLMKESRSAPDEVVRRLSAEQFSGAMLLKRISKN